MKTETCTKCSRQFLIIDQEEKFVRERGLPLPTWCPACRQERRMQLRGGNQLYKTTCQKCGKNIVVSYDPQTTKNTILCQQDYDAYFQENDLIIDEPIPDL